MGEVEVMLSNSIPPGGDEGDVLTKIGVQNYKIAWKKPSVNNNGGGGGIVYRFGYGLKQNGLDVSVDTVSDFSGDNTLPMTAAGVQATVGNIEALLGTI